jgi:hypothetical protein
LHALNLLDVRVYGIVPEVILSKKRVLQLNASAQKQHT